MDYINVLVDFVRRYPEYNDQQVKDYFDRHGWDSKKYTYQELSDLFTDILGQVNAKLLMNKIIGSLETAAALDPSINYVLNNLKNGVAISPTSPSTLPEIYQILSEQEAVIFYNIFRQVPVNDEILVQVRAIVAGMELKDNLKAELLVKYKRAEAKIDDGEIIDTEGLNSDLIL
jgi:hypothetical protein